MATSNSVATIERCGLQSSSDPELPTGRDGLADPDETTPLLRINRALGNHSERWSFARSVVALSAFFDRNAGLLLVAASQLFFTAMNFSVKLLNSLQEPVPVLELIWIRMVVTYVCAISYMFLQKVPDPLLGPKGIRGLLVLRGFSGFIGISGMYYSLKYLSLSDATVLTFLAPILTGFSGAIFLKEPISLSQTFSGLCSFFGVVLISRPQFLFHTATGLAVEVVTPEKRILSVTAGLVGVLGQTGSLISLRAIGKWAHQAHPLHPMTFYCLNCGLVSALGMVIFKISPVIPTDPLWLTMLFLIGILGLTAQTLLFLGLQRETASRGALATYTSVVFAIMFEFIVSHTIPPALSIAGTVIIMSSAIYTSLTKQTASNAATGPSLGQPRISHPDSNDAEHP